MMVDEVSPGPPCPITHVEGKETVFRSVTDGPTYFSMDDGTLRLSHSAFNDPMWQPSVDRQCMRSDPELSRRHEDAGVVQLNVEAVRQIDVWTNTKKGAPDFKHTVDVRHEPEVENHAHATVQADPQAVNNAFKRVKEALCRIADEHGWIALPKSRRASG